MREDRAIIGTKGLITLPKEWRDTHNLETGNVRVVYRLGGALIVTPANKSLSDLEEVCIKILEKGPSIEELRDQITTLKGAQTLLESLLATGN